MELFFDNSYSIRKIADVANDKEAMQQIRNFCKDRSYKIPYIRMWKSVLDNGPVVAPYWTYDVGSHTQFFYLTCK